MMDKENFTLVIEIIRNPDWIISAAGTYRRDLFRFSFIFIGYRTDLPSGTTYYDAAVAD